MAARKVLAMYSEESHMNETQEKVLQRLIENLEYAVLNNGIVDGVATEELESAEEQIKLYVTALVQNI